MKQLFIRQQTTLFHVTGKCTEPHWPDADFGHVWKLFLNQLKDYYICHKVKTHAFVMMSNHYHWLCGVDLEVHKAKKLIQGFHSDHLLLDGPPSVSIIDNSEAYRQNYAYIYKNPVRAGIVRKATEYPFSTLPYVLGRKEHSLDFPIFDYMNIHIDAAKPLRLIAGQPSLYKY